MIKIIRLFSVNVVVQSSKKFEFFLTHGKCYHLGTPKLVNNFSDHYCLNVIYLINNNCFKNKFILNNGTKQKGISTSIFLYATWNASSPNYVDETVNMTSSAKKQNKKNKNKYNLEKVNDIKDLHHTKKKRHRKGLSKKRKRALCKKKFAKMSDDLNILKEHRQILRRELKLLCRKKIYSKDDLSIQNDSNYKLSCSSSALKYNNLRNCFSIDCIEKAVDNLVDHEITLPSFLMNKNITFNDWNKKSGRLSVINSADNSIIFDKAPCLKEQKIKDSKDLSKNLNDSDNFSEYLNSSVVENFKIVESIQNQEINLCDTKMKSVSVVENDWHGDENDGYEMSWNDLKAKKRSEREQLEEAKFKELRENEFTLRATGLLDEPLDTKEQRVEFKVLSYNVLSQTLLEDNMRLYRNHNQSYLNWCYRSELLMKELDEVDADIMCLQEVQEDHKVTFFDELKKKGYEGIYKKRTGDKTDGCAVYYKKSKFQLVDYATVEFFQHGIQILDRDNIAIVVKLHPVGYPNNPLVVATTHLLYNPRRHDIKLAQMQVLLAEIERFAFKKKNTKFPYHPVILTGDFNLEPYTAVYQLLYGGELSYEVLDRKKMMYAGERPYPDNTGLPPAFGPPMGKLLLPPFLGITDYCQHYSIVSTRNLPLERKKDLQDDTLIGIYNSDRQNLPRECHECETKPYLFSTGVLYNKNFNFHSVYYHDDDKNESEATTKHDNWLTVDYIFYTPLEDRVRKHQQLQLINRSRLPTVKECEQHIKNIPNRICPSDHLPLIATFYLRIPSNSV